MATIYILEDDLNIQEIEAYALKNSGYQTEGFDNAREFFKKVSERVPSLLLLDIMLPDADGLDVLRKLRSMPETKKQPIFKCCLIIGRIVLFFYHIFITVKLK